MTGDTTGNLAFQTGAGANTISVPNGTGTIAVQGVSTNIVSGTAVASTSGTSIDFTSIPSWVKRITVMFNGVSSNGTSGFLIQVGTGGTPTTSGYNSATSRVWSSVNIYTSTSGFIYGHDQAGFAWYGQTVITNINSNNWVFSGTIGNLTGSTPMTAQGGGAVSLGGVLNMVRITNVNGTDTFDAGSINILYE
jgi:hypothetical protein